MKIIKIPIKVLIILVGSLIPFLGNAVSQEINTWNKEDIFQVGEELIYNVSYLGFDLGRIKIKLLQKESDSTSSWYKAVAYMDTYKGVPLVDLHSVFESTFSNEIYSKYFQARDKDNDQWKLFKYHFIYPESKVLVEESIWKSNTVNRRDTISVDTFYQDGLSLFYFARGHLRDKKQLKVPVFVNEKKGYAQIRFTGQQKNEKIKAVDYPVDVLYFDGVAEFIGVFGLTGGFEGWFSNDYAHVPILAKMKVLIGNIRIELMEWKKPGWSPPRYSNRKK